MYMLYADVVHIMYRFEYLIVYIHITSRNNFWTDDKADYI